MKTVVALLAQAVFGTLKNSSTRVAAESQRVVGKLKIKSLCKD
jgi:hypothetical protein